MQKRFPIRVLQIVTYMGRGGLETMLMNYYRNIDRANVQFDFMVHRSFEADYDAEIRSMGGIIYRMPRLNPFSRSYGKKLDRFFMQHQEYRIVHAHLDCMSGIPLRFADKDGVPVRISHSHNNNQTKDVKYPLKLLFKKVIPWYANELFACSRAAGKWMFGSNKFQILNNAIDTEKFRYNELTRIEKRKELCFSESAFLVGHVGRFMEQKNHIFLLDIFSELCKMDKDARLLLVGDGPLRSEIEERARHLQIVDRVIFAGVRSDVAELMQAMDLFLFPSKFEGLPVTLVEAQTAGLPCVISDMIPEDSVVTDDLVTVESLRSSPREWALQVLRRKGEPRMDHSSEVAAAGFDIRESAKWLEAFYLEKWDQ